MMNIETVNNEGVVTVKPYGSLISSTAGELEEVIKSIISDDIKSLTLDMSEVDFISSRGIRVIVTAQKLMNDRDFVLLKPNASTVEILRMSGLLNFLTIQEN